MKYGKLTLGQIEAIINKLGGEEGAELLLADKLVISLKERKLRSVEKVEIRIPATTRFDSKSILAECDFLKSIEKNGSPEGEVVMTLTTVLREDEDSISGSEYELRLRKVEGTLGYSQAVWLVRNQDKLPKEFMDLLGKNDVDFPSTVARHVDGSRGVPCLQPCGGRWFLGWSWFESDFYSLDRVARFRK